MDGKSELMMQCRLGMENQILQQQLN